jgi:hypothetical protein
MLLNSFDVLVFKINFKKYYFNILKKNTLKNIIPYYSDIPRKPTQKHH